jgi:hypothetical protein
LRFRKPPVNALIEFKLKIGECHKEYVTSLAQVAGQTRVKETLLPVPRLQFGDDYPENINDRRQVRRWTLESAGDCGTLKTPGKKVTYDTNVRRDCRRERVDRGQKLGGRWLKLQEMHNEASDPLGARPPRLDSYPA